MKKVIQFFKIAGSILALLISFLIGWADRFILLFIPWKKSPNLFSERFYRIHFPDSFMRVAVVGLIVGLVYLVTLFI